MVDALEQRPAGRVVPISQSLDQVADVRRRVAAHVCPAPFSSLHPSYRNHSLASQENLCRFRRGMSETTSRVASRDRAFVCDPAQVRGHHRQPFGIAYSVPGPPNSSSNGDWIMALPSGFKATPFFGRTRACDMWRQAREGRRADSRRPSSSPPPMPGQRSQSELRGF